MLDNHKNRTNRKDSCVLHISVFGLTLAHFTQLIYYVQNGIGVRSVGSSKSKLSDRSELSLINVLRVVVLFFCASLDKVANKRA